MRKTITFIFFIYLMLPFSSLNAQQWIQEEPIPTDKEIKDIYFVDADWGWAVGEDGLIMVTADGGEHYLTQNSLSSEHLYGISFVDKKTGWVVGNNSTILHTEDAGNTWQAQSNSNVSLKAVQFLDNQRGWAMSFWDKMLWTTNGGDSWQETQVAPSTSLYDFVFVDELHGWLIGDSSVWHTNDGGQSWQEQDLNNTMPLYAIDFVDTEHGWLVGEQGTMFRTEDGGQTWISVIIQTTGGYPLKDVYFHDSLNGLTIRDYIMYETHDGGQNWEFLSGGVYSKLFFVDSLQGWALGDDSYGQSVWETVDGGVNWESLWINSYEAFEDIHALNKNEAWVVGEAGLLYSGDGGKNWELRGNGIQSPCSEIEFAEDGQNGWIIASWLRVYRTTDGGDNWTISLPLGLGIITEHLYEIDFVDSQNGWVGSSYGDIYRTTDAGQTWQAIATGFNSTAVLQFATTQKGWMTSGGTTYKTTDAGFNWALDSIFATKQVNDIFFLDSLQGWAAACSNDGSFSMHTSDGGVNWTIDTVPVSISSCLSSITFADAMHGWLTEYNGTIWYSSDGGQNWTVQDNGTDQPIYAVSAADSMHCWGAGEKGTIVRYQNCVLAQPIISESLGTLSTGAYQAYQWFKNGEEIQGATQATYSPGSEGVYSLEVGSVGDCSIESNAFVMDLDSITTTKETEAERTSFLLYPNPAKGLLSLDFTSDFIPNRLSLIDLSGRLLQNYTKNQIKSNMQLDLSALPAGVYWLRATDPKRQITKKIVLME